MWMPVHLQTNCGGTNVNAPVVFPPENGADDYDVTM